MIICRFTRAYLEYLVVPTSSYVLDDTCHPICLNPGCVQVLSCHRARLCDDASFDESGKIYKVTTIFPPVPRTLVKMTFVAVGQEKNGLVASRIVGSLPPVIPTMYKMLCLIHAWLIDTPFHPTILNQTTAIFLWYRHKATRRRHSHGHPSPSSAYYLN